jgi:hypothetical protein
MIDFIHIPKNGGTSILNQCKFVKYNGHNYGQKHEKSMIILREPVSRFTSAVKYSIKEGIKNQEENILEIVEKGYTSPSTWAEVMFGEETEHEMYENIMLEVLNKNHYIDEYVPKYKWTYTEQYRWLNSRKKAEIIIKFENLNERIYELFGIELKKENETEKSEEIFSKKATILLKNFYCKDFEIYNMCFK